MDIPQSGYSYYRFYTIMDRIKALTPHFCDAQLEPIGGIQMKHKPHARLPEEKWRRERIHFLLISLALFAISATLFYFSYISHR
jgi:hypothetical protein